MDNLAAAPGTGPNTSPLKVLRPPTRTKAFEELSSGGIGAYGQGESTVVMGILNVTEDSFSDGGRYIGADAAVDQGLRMHYAGAQVIDVGGESTRPDAVAVDPAVEAERVVPVIRTLAKAGAYVSVDTKNASTARAAIEAGARMVNDVSGLQLTDEMAGVIAETGVKYVLMHARGEVKSSDPKAEYEDVVAEVLAELGQCLERLRASGVKDEQILLDPGLGFNKEAEDNWALIRALPQLRELGFPVLVGASRKRFLGQLLLSGGKAREVRKRDAATAALTAILASQGVWGVRVHEVQASLDAVAVARALAAPAPDSSVRKSGRA